MRGRHILDRGRPLVWSHNTSYVGAAGLHSENSYSINAKGNRLSNEQDNIYSTIEKMHRRELNDIRRDKRNLELSMMAYSQKMSEIHRSRLSVPTIITPSAGKSGKRKGVSLPSLTHGEAELLALTLSSVASRSGSYRSREERQTSANSRKSDKSNTGINDDVFDKQYLTPSYSFRNRSTFGSVESAMPYRERKISTISPPSEKELLQIRGRRSTDSAYESMSCSEKDGTLSRSSFATVFQESTNNQSEDSKIENPNVETKEDIQNLEISSFPDIKVESEMIRKSFSESETPVRPKLIKAKTVRKISVESNKPKKSKKKEFDYKKLQKRMEMEAKRKKAMALLRQKMLEKQEQEEKEKQPIEPEKKSNVGTCQSFRYSLAIEELLKKPDPLAVPKTSKELVASIDFENGRIVHTLGPAVLTVVGMDELQNVRGLTLTKGNTILSRQVSREPASVTMDTSISRQTTRLPVIPQRQPTFQERMSREATISRTFSRSNSQKRFDYLRRQSTVNVISAQA